MVNVLIEACSGFLVTLHELDDIVIVIENEPAYLGEGNGAINPHILQSAGGDA
jgi:hypothetical protein